MKLFLESLNLINNEYLISFVFGYPIFGFVSYMISGWVSSYVWDKSEQTIKKINQPSKFRGHLSTAIREPFKWMPTWVGVLERVLYTTAIIFNQYTLIGIWLALKVIGEWNDTRYGSAGTTRIRANSFLIGTAVSLILGILGGVISRLIIDHQYLYRLLLSK